MKTTTRTDDDQPDGYTLVRIEVPPYPVGGGMTEGCTLVLVWPKAEWEVYQYGHYGD